jgi:hypothetical protein
MSRYEFYMPPVRTWPAIWWARFLWLYETAMDKVIPWRWMCSLAMMPGSPSWSAARGVQGVAHEGISAHPGH